MTPDEIRAQIRAHQRCIDMGSRKADQHRKSIEAYMAQLPAGPDFGRDATTANRQHVQREQRARLHNPKEQSK